MNSLKYLKRKEILFKYCFVALRDHFASQEELGKWYEQIDSDEKKDRFIKTSAYYASLVKNGDWHVNLPESQPVVEYFTNTYKFIAIFSLIESLSDLKYIDFYRYLKRKDTATPFPIKKTDLDALYNRYNKDYGAIRRCIGFFRNLSPERQASLISKLKVRNTEPSIENFAKYLYQLRSGFVHGTELVHAVSTGTWVGFKADNLVVCELSIGDAMQFFEEGLLAWFQVKET